jgi:hypothetical protein
MRLSLLAAAVNSPQRVPKGESTFLRTLLIGTFGGNS